MSTYARIIIVFAAMLGMAFHALADDDLYAFLLSSSLLGEAWEAKKVDYGIHYSSIEKTRNQNGEEISAITLDIEGPVKVPKNITIENALESNINNILSTTAINQKFQSKYQVHDGIGATIIQVNGENLGLIEYEVPSNKMIYVKHGLILKNERLYTLTLIFFDPNINRKRGMAMEMLAMAAISSGKL